MSADSEKPNIIGGNWTKYCTVTKSVGRGRPIWTLVVVRARVAFALGQVQSIPVAIFLNHDAQSAAQTTRFRLRSTANLVCFFLPIQRVLFAVIAFLGATAVLEKVEAMEENLREIFSDPEICEFIPPLTYTLNCGGAVGNRLRRRTSDQTVLGSNPAMAAALSAWTRLFTPIVPRRSFHISFYSYLTILVKLYWQKKLWIYSEPEALAGDKLRGYKKQRRTHIFLH